ncbi:hypothetical protein HPP92_000968 [Vanilla planifolia]|uniref:Uncharacterized protein n=1 Tax=Vanilla planifolia TaxID=51239 RepID=A0A835S3A5_VANPL|nr:hypothetical protein HPP92_000968 [Vanilla planifolia]
MERLLEEAITRDVKELNLEFELSLATQRSCDDFALELVGDVFTLHHLVLACISYVEELNLA